VYVTFKKGLYTVSQSRLGAGVPLTSPRLYGFSDTDDFRQAILYIAQLYPHAPLLGLGFSCGANVLTRYVAEEGESCRLVSACALASVCVLSLFTHLSFLIHHFSLGIYSRQDMRTFSKHLPLRSQLTRFLRSLEDNWFTRHVYSKSLTVGLKKIVCDHIDTIVQFPDSRFAQALPTLMSLSLPTMFQFDSLISVHSAASSPFDDAWAYYAYSSSHDKLDGVRIPFLALNSHDDPIAQCVPQDYNRNEWVTLVVTHGGGHLGWFQPGGAENRWARRPVLEWFRATGEDIRLEPRKARSIEWRDGWLVEVGSEGLSCQEIGGGGTLWPGKGGAGL
jgi:predicted alpha/beta-fold hydrolase